MRILLVGEYSNLHNTLKEGLQAVQHEVVLVSSGDGFKNFPSDYSIKPKLCHHKVLNVFRQLIFRLFKYDFAKLEIGLRFYFLLPKFKNFDVVQLINERPIQTSSTFELFLLKKLKKQNPNLFLLSSGPDYLNTQFYIENKNKKSILIPFFDNNNLVKEYQFVLDYISPKHKKIHDYLYHMSKGIIASDIDYLIPLVQDSKFLGLIPNPINHKTIQYNESGIDDTIVIFLGINKWNYYQKGINYFEKALEIVKEKYAHKVKIVITNTIPYNEYITLYNQAHILLDQTFSYDQGYNALEAMAKGKVVFTGAEEEFTNYYNLTERVCINAKPDVNYLVNELSFLIENPQEIIIIGKRARAFVEKEHDCVKIAEKYKNLWEKN